jgi:thiaminase
MRAQSLIEEIQAELAPAAERLRTHPYLLAFEAGTAPLGALRPFVGAQRAIIASDARSVALLAARSDETLFLDVLDGERAALAAIPALAAAAGMDAEALAAHETPAEAFAYAAYMAWLGAFGHPAGVAAAYLVNFAAWGGACARLAAALRRHHGLSGDALRFLELFAEPDPTFDAKAAAVVQAGLEAGVPGRLLREPARLLQGYELLFWDRLQREL